MFGRALGVSIFTVAFLSVLSGCDNRPKIVMPTERAPPAPRPRTTGGGGAPAEPAAPAGDQGEKQEDSKKPPADSTPPEDKK